MKASRGPLRQVILASTGQDVLQCTKCRSCDDLMADGMDLTFGEVMRAAARDDARALKNDTLWACDELLERGPKCQSGLDIASVILALRREAELRGFTNNSRM